VLNLALKMSNRKEKKDPADHMMTYHFFLDNINLLSKQLQLLFVLLFQLVQTYRKIGYESMSQAPGSIVIPNQQSFANLEDYSSNTKQIYAN
jgi:hypothetical protein